MKQIGTAFENFAFKAFDFSGRATLIEYWVAMPLIWSIIAFLLYGDAVEFWGMLLAKQVPPLNPLYWDGVFVFLLTIIPRLTLTVRRLHDSGKNGKWAKLPFLTVISSIVLVLGLMSAMATSSIGGSQASDSLTMFAVLFAMTIGNLDSVWEMLFATAAVVDAAGLDAIIGMLAEMVAPQDPINIRRGISGVATGIQDDPAVGSISLLVMIGMIATPFVTFSLHVFFMISPTKPDHELDKMGPLSGASLRRQGGVSDNPFAGYKHLYDKTPEQKAAMQAHAKQEIRSLYQQRVLGSQNTT